MEFEALWFSCGNCDPGTSGIVMGNIEIFSCPSCKDDNAITVKFINNKELNAIGNAVIAELSKHQ